jgi:hypothetical protein
MGCGAKVLRNGGWALRKQEKVEAKTKIEIEAKTKIREETENTVKKRVAGKGRSLYFYYHNLKTPTYVPIASEKDMASLLYFSHQHPFICTK